jgi:hypothetical protein
MSLEPTVASEPYSALTIHNQNNDNSPSSSQQDGSKEHEKTATSADDGVPDGGLRAWLVVIGVRTPFIFC